MTLNFCSACGGTIRLSFLQYKCANGCFGRVSKVLTFSSFWSHYASTPKFLPYESGQDTENRVKIADCVVLFNELPPTPGVAGFMGMLGQSTITVPETKLRVVRVVVNKTWDGVVGKEVPVSVEEWKALVIHSEQATEQLTNDWNIETMACLVRS